MPTSQHGNRPPPRPLGVCLHCSRTGPLKARGLCWRCFENLGVRAEYPILDTPGSRRGIGGVAGAAGAVERTDALPGSEAKILVMSLRAAKGQPVFHPLDGPQDLG